MEKDEPQWDGHVVERLPASRRQRRRDRGFAQEAAPQEDDCLLPEARANIGRQAVRRRSATTGVRRQKRSAIRVSGRRDLHFRHHRPRRGLMGVLPLHRHLGNGLIRESDFSHGLLSHARQPKHHSL